MNGAPWCSTCGDVGRVGDDPCRACSAYVDPMVLDDADLQIAWLQDEVRELRRKLDASQEVLSRMVAACPAQAQRLMREFERRAADDV